MLTIHTFSIDGVTVVHDITFPTFLNASTSRLFFGNSEVDHTTYDNMVVVEVVADADGDGVPDSSDVCPGFDDNVDTDQDGIPDGCDSTPTGDDDSDDDSDSEDSDDDWLR